MKRSFDKLMTLALGLLVTGCNTTPAEDGAQVYNQFEAFSLEMQVCGPIYQEGNRFDEFTDNPFVKVSEQPTSTFSVDADGASYGVMRRYLNYGLAIDPASVRIEEFMNYFTFDYAAPKNDDAIAINAEVGPCPWNPQHHLLRLGLKGKELKENEMPRANFVFLVDVSGSMQGNDRLDLLKSGLKELLFQLHPDDRISLITYSGKVEKLLESTPVTESGRIKEAINRLSANGSTAGGEALKMAYEEALANYDAKCNNRIILGTDGDFNVGVTSTDALVEMVEGYAKKGIYLSCLGFGMGNLNDGMMEKISNSGNGTYHYIDCEDEMMKVFVTERERFVSVANDTKCQITFDKDIVDSYRLIGYENRVMNNEDFTDDEKDAGEIGAGQTITALYEIELKDREFSDVTNQAFVTFDCRYKKTLGDESIPLQLKLTTEQIFNKNGRSDEFHFAAGIAAYGMILRDSPYKGDATIDMAKQLVNQGLSFDLDNRRKELLQLMDKYVKLKE